MLGRIKLQRLFNRFKKVIILQKFNFNKIQKINYHIKRERKYNKILLFFLISVVKKSNILFESEAYFSMENLRLSKFSLQTHIQTFKTMSKCSN
jgi:hypothetical protein